MKTHPDCYPCFLKQTLNTARMAGAGHAEQIAALNHALEILPGCDPDLPPTAASHLVQRRVRLMLGNGDPYREAKQASTRQALALYPSLKETVAVSDDPLDTALRLSIAGNIIDMAVPHSFDLEESIERALTTPFAIDDREAFRRALDAADTVLYLADNAGETVFDRVLIETMGIPVVYAVKGGPTFNDATRQDALEAGLNGMTRIVETGSDGAGTLLYDCSGEFLQRFEQAGMIISKGQASFESLNGRDDPRLFFLLQVKCHVISDFLGVPLGSIVLKQDGQEQKQD